MITYDEFEKFAFSDYAIEEKIVNVIDNSGRQILIESLSQFLSYTNCTIKIQNMEKYNNMFYEKCQELKSRFKHNGPVTCHVFRSFENSLSFPLHSDPDDVLLYVIEGSKLIEMNSQLIELKKGNELFISASIPHRAMNKNSSLMLSFGLEKFMIDKVEYELDVLSQNN